MGTKFANLQIYSPDAAAVAALCPQDTVVQSVENWVTVTGAPIEWGTAQAIAKRLSKSLPHPILSTEYFDDDYVEFSVYQNGKCTAKHIPVSYEHFRRKLGKPAQFVEAFSLGAECAEQLKVIFQETDPARSVRLMECVLHCPIWPAPDTSSTDPAFLTEYLANKKKKQNIKNASKLVLLDEEPGDFEGTYPIVRYESPGGDRKSIWEISAEGTLAKAFSADFKGRISEACSSDRYFLLTVTEWSPQEPAMRMYTFDHRGDVLNQFLCADNRPRPIFPLTEELLFSNGRCWDFASHQLKWDLLLGDFPYGIEGVCQLPGQRYAALYDLGWYDQERAHLSIFGEDGSIQHSIALPSTFHWTVPVVHDGQIYVACGISETESVLCCYDDCLTEQWRLPYPGRYHHADPFFDQKTATIYFHAAAGDLCSFDLNGHCIKARRNTLDMEATPLGVIPGLGLAVMTGGSLFEIWNSELQMISRHRTKGTIQRVIHRNGCHYVLSQRRGDWETADNGEKYHTGSLFLYELKPV